MILSSPFLCVITDEALNPVYLAEEALKGGAEMIQLRHKSASGNQLFLWAIEIRRLCHHYQALFIINDRVDIAMASESDGVHLGQQDIPIGAARKLMGKKSIIGISTSSLEEAARAEKEGADYIGFGHIFPTFSKIKESPPLGPEMLKKAATIVSLPIIAIGGISIDNAPLLISNGASGVAVLSAVSKADRPSIATYELVSALNRQKS
ncbi:MAG: thiamine phosphate synthase [Chlorobium sp.]|nr:MAG: thiamine phosphate synthase [Chlorobium sp.]